MFKISSSLFFVKFIGILMYLLLVFGSVLGLPIYFGHPDNDTVAIWLFVVLFFWGVCGCVCAFFHADGGVDNKALTKYFAAMVFGGFLVVPAAITVGFLNAVVQFEHTN